MKKRRKAATVFGLFMACAVLVSGCGGAAKSEATDAATTEAMEAPAEYATDDIYFNESASYDEMPEEEGKADTGAAGGGKAEVSDPSRKLIKNVNLDTETEEFDTLMQTVTQKTESLGGYIESSNVYNGSYYNGNTNRNASLTLRIPAEHLNEFLSAVAENSNVINRDESVTDVTLRYVDMKSHKEALETEQTRLLELLEKAESVEDIITIESRLSEVRYQIESMESQLRTMDNQVSYSTVYLYISEVKKLTPIKEQTTWEKISTGFMDSLENVGYGLKNFFIGLIIRLPYLAVWAVVILIAVLFFKLIRKGSKKRKAAKQEKQLMKQQEKEKQMIEQQEEKTKEQKEEK